MEKQRIAKIIKENRTKLGFTQTELSEKTGMSLRSIQRIEKAEVRPRDYSLRMLAKALDCSFEEDKDAGVKPGNNKNLPAKIILSAGSVLMIVLIALAFISQSSTFPETDFENQLNWLSVLVLILIAQWFIWVKYTIKSKV